MTLYADEDDSTPRLAVIYGNTENIAHYTTIKNAIITKLNLSYDEENDELYYDAVFLESSGENSVKLSQEFGETLSEKMEEHTKWILIVLYLEWICQGEHRGLQVFL